MIILLNNSGLYPLYTWVHNYQVYTEKRFNYDNKEGGNYLVRVKNDQKLWAKKSQARQKESSRVKPCANQLKPVLF